MENKPANVKKIVLGSSNLDKIREMNAIAKNYGVEFVLPDCAKFEPDENGKTFEENARIKAIEASRVSSGELFLADDSGLCVEYLKGAPGILSARYAPDADKRIAKLLKAMKDVPERNAYFKCALCLVDKHGNVLYENSAIVRGEIAKEKAGNNGFGYDPIFILKKINKTMAQLNENEKNILSHRGQALNNMLKWFNEVSYGRKF